MKINSIKSVKPGNQFWKKILAVLLSITVIVISYLFLTNVNEAAKNTVSIVRVKSGDGIPAKSVITKDNIEKYEIIQKEYDADNMVLYDNVDEVLNKYSAYFLRGKTPIYKDQLMKEKPLKNEWLYKMNKSLEVLTLKYSSIEGGGDILTPGDRIRVRVSYEQDVGMMADGMATESRITKTDMLFKEITVRDLLNGSGHSIYEVYREVMKLSADERQKVMTGKEFISNIRAQSLVLEATSEQVDKYAKYAGKENVKYLITILSRSGNNDIFDQLPTTQKEVESWILKTN